MDELEKFYNLPQDLQNAIIAEKTALTVYDLGEQNGLSKEGIGKIGSLVKAVLMKDFPLSDFKTELELRTGLDVDKSLKIAEAIDREIFDPVKIYLLKKEENIIEQEEEPKEINVFEKQNHLFKDSYKEKIEE